MESDESKSVVSIKLLENNNNSFNSAKDQQRRRGIIVETIEEESTTTNNLCNFVFSFVNKFFGNKTEADMIEPMEQEEQIDLLSVGGDAQREDEEKEDSPVLMESIDPPPNELLSPPPTDSLIIDDDGGDSGSIINEADHHRQTASPTEEQSLIPIIVKEPNWAELPKKVLEKIFGMTCVHDVYFSRYVCRNWKSAGNDFFRTSTTLNWRQMVHAVSIDESNQYRARLCADCMDMAFRRMPRLGTIDFCFARPVRRIHFESDFGKVIWKKFSKLDRVYFEHSDIERISDLYRVVLNAISTCDVYVDGKLTKIRH